jgi:glycosyltransferase involved in cell wall biosynthesis
MARVCLDGFNLALPDGSGVATYARNLERALAGLGHQTQVLYSATRDLGRGPLLDQISLVDAPAAGRWSALRRAAGRLAPAASISARAVAMTGEVITADLAPRFPPGAAAWGARDVFHRANVAHRLTRRLTPLKLGRAPGADLMHWTYPLPLFEPRIPNIYTLHDLAPLRLPYATLDDKRAYLDLCRAAVDRADRVFTVSEHARGEIVRLLGAPEAKVVNTFQAAELPAAWLDRDDDTLAAELHAGFGLEPASYFVYFGALEPRKNLHRLLEAYFASGVQTALVIVGRAWLDAGQRRRVRPEAAAAMAAVEAAIARSPNVRRFDYLGQRALATLVQGARATLFPSLHEGFGLPVLESMLLGTPVIASTAGALPEVAGDAARLVDPYDVEAIGRAIRDLDADADLRAALAERGRVQAARFSPARYRERLRDAYRPLL